MRPFKIIHVLRAPLGGLFRHVIDLARAQIGLGHQVGLILDSQVPDPRSAEILEELKPSLELGLHTLSIPRAPHAKDLFAWIRVVQIERCLRPDILHGHGAKGGFLARAPRFFLGHAHTTRVYTPHGGVLYYLPGSLSHFFYHLFERLLEYNTDLFLFESNYAEDMFRQNFIDTKKPTLMSHNGISSHEFSPILTEDPPYDLVGIGELTHRKGWGTLLDALVYIRERTGEHISLLLIGSDSAKGYFQRKVEQLHLQDQVSFLPAMPAREGFAKGRIFIAPSWDESLPYIILEAAGAQIPIITTTVGGIPEIFGPFQDRLIPPKNVVKLAEAILVLLKQDETERRAQAAELHRWVSINFQISNMIGGVMAGYQAALNLKKPDEEIKE